MQLHICQEWHIGPRRLGEFSVLHAGDRAEPPSTGHIPCAFCPVLIMSKPCPTFYASRKNLRSIWKLSRVHWICWELDLVAREVLSSASPVLAVENGGNIMVLLCPPWGPYGGRDQLDE